MRQHTYLFEQLIRRELRRRYKGSSLGVLWYLVNPLVMLGAYTLMFGHVLKVVSYADYPIFLLGGLAVWTFFQQSLLAAADSLIEQGGLVRKARFPRQAIPAASVAAQLGTFGAMIVILIPISVALRPTFKPTLLLLPLLIVLLIGFVLGCALIVSVLHAYFRDIAPILAAAMLPWFFLTPIFFEPTPQHFSFVAQHPWVGTVLLWVNPVAPFVQGIREILYSGVAPWGQLAYGVAAAVVALALGSRVFALMEGELAVVV